MSGCVFGASLDELDEPVNNTSNNATISPTNNASNNSTNSSTNNTSNNTNGVDCNDLESVLDDRKMPTPLRQGGIQVDWRDQRMIVIADYGDDFAIAAIDETTSYAVTPKDAPIPAVGLGDVSTSFDIALTNIDPVRFMIAESRASELRLYYCNAGQGAAQARCVVVEQADAIAADDDVQAAFVPGASAVMVGYSFKNVGPNEKREYRSNTVLLEPSPQVKGGNVFIRVSGSNVQGVDFSHVPGTPNKFNVAGGALGGTGFFHYQADQLVVDPSSCGDLDTSTLAPYKVKTQHDSLKALFRTGQGLILTSCQNEQRVSLSAATVWDFDFVPFDDGDAAVWIDGPVQAKAVRGAVVTGNTTTNLTFRDDSNIHHYVRIGKIGEEIIVVFGGGEEGLTMIRGTVDKLKQCYGNR